MIPLANWNEILYVGIPAVDSPSKEDILNIVSFATKAKKILEIGTKHGRTTINLAKFSPKDAIVYSLDLDQKQDKSHLDYYPDFLSKIRFIEADSMAYNYIANSFSSESFDLIFIDGGHEYNTVMIDTQNAIRLIKPDGVILWHDYGDGTHLSQVGKVLEVLDVPTIPIGRYLGFYGKVK